MLELPDFSSIKEVATRTKLSRSSVHRAIRLGRLRVLRPDGVRRLLIPADALRAFLQPSPRCETNAPRRSAATGTTRDSGTCGASPPGQPDEEDPEATHGAEDRGISNGTAE
jgi:excisionase family DNA binding protein